MSRARFIRRRLLQSIPVVFGVTLVVFLLIHLVPGDPARTALGAQASDSAVADLRHEWGLDRSLPHQYGDFVERLLGGDLGTSTTYGRSTGSLIAERLPVTLWLLVYSTVLIALISIPVGLWAASRPGALHDRAIRLLSVIALGVPSYWAGILLIQIMGIKLGVLPTAGFGDGALGHLRSMLLPSLTVALGVIPLMVRSLRVEMLDVAQSDYVLTARSKGLSEFRIRSRHVLRNALVPAVTVLAVNVGFLIGWTVVIEQVFSLGGLGALMLQAITRRDFQVVQGVTLVLALIAIVVSLLADLLHSLLDPRVEAL
jgi:peptide/nickel transport system permease protein